MSRTIFNFLFSLFILGAMSLVLSSSLLLAEPQGKSSESKGKALREPVKTLFDHKKHRNPFNKSSTSCTDCHTFSVKAPSSDPLAAKVPSGYLQPNKKVCHECHLAKVSLARVNQCSLCHAQPEKLIPENHKLAWKKRHGHVAQMEPESCHACHKDNQNSCNNCHTQKNTLKPIVHRANFRMTHAIEARGNPARCTTCHTSSQFCSRCHESGNTR